MKKETSLQIPQNIRQYEQIFMPKVKILDEIDKFLKAVITKTH